MNTPSARFYVYSASIFILFFSIELALEYRHYLLGYKTPIFGEKQLKVAQADNKQKATQASPYGPTENFPFRSKVLSKDKLGTRIWIASASHAVGGRIAASKVFPNLICEHVAIQQDCEVINGSLNGIDINRNIALLNEHTETYRPDLAVLYQMSMFVANQQKEITSKNKSEGENNSIIDFSGAHTLFQSLSLYTHLTNLIGGTLELEGQLKDKLPSSAAENFRRQLKQFIQASIALGVRPVLTTFATSHDLKNIDQMPLKDKTNFVKWVATPYLSPEGWINTIEELNVIIRELSIEEQVLLIDLSASMNGRYQYFVDFVHFNEAGHAEAAKIIGTKLDQALNQAKISS